MAQPFAVGDLIFAKFKALYYLGIIHVVEPTVVFFLDNTFVEDVRQVVRSPPSRAKCYIPDSANAVPYERFDTDTYKAMLLSSYQLWCAEDESTTLPAFIPLSNDNFNVHAVPFVPSPVRPRLELNPSAPNLSKCPFPLCPYVVTSGSVSSSLRHHINTKHLVRNESLPPCATLWAAHKWVSCDCKIGIVFHTKAGLGCRCGLNRSLPVFESPCRPFHSDVPFASYVDLASSMSSSPLFHDPLEPVVVPLQCPRKPSPPTFDHIKEARILSELSPQLGSPSLLDLVMARRPVAGLPTHGHVRSECLRIWGSLITAALDSQLEDDFVPLFFFPMYVLQTGKRSGKRWFAARSNSIQERLRKWERDGFLFCWKEFSDYVPPRKASSSKSSQQLAFQRAVNLVRSGDLRAGLKAVTSMPPVPIDDAVLDKMASKHPHGSCSPVDAPESVPYHFNSSDVLKELKSFPKNSTAGPFGVTPRTLLDAWKSDCTPFNLAVVRFINALANAQLPVSLAPFLAGARLVGLPKGADDVRPIAVGEVWRRLAAKCLLAQVQEKIKSLFSGSQFGISCPGGVEILIHSFRQALESESVECFVKWDFKNAFNEINRTKMLSACSSLIPELFPFAQWCYQSESMLFYGASCRIIPSACGTQQGDPLGPLLFCMLLLHFLNLHHPSSRLVKNDWYMDDGVTGGSVSDNVALWNCFVQFGPSFGLWLNDLKCEWIWGKGSSDRLSPIPTMPVTHRSDVTLLGSPIFGTVNALAYLRGKVDHALTLIDRLSMFEDVQSGYLLLRYCLTQAKVNHWMRTVPIDTWIQLAHLIDSSCSSALSGLLGLAPSGLALEEARLAVSRGGLGLREVVVHAVPAYVSSFSSASNWLVVNGREPLKSALCDSYISNLKESLGPSVSDNIISQHHLSLLIDEKNARSIYSRSLSLRDRIRRVLISRSHVGAFLQIPWGPKTVMASSAFRISLKRRLGIPMLEQPTFCGFCNSYLDTHADHAIVCKNKGNLIRRHNVMRNTVFQIGVLAKIGPSMEKKGIIGDHRNLRPADVLLPSFPPAPNRCVDIAITDAIQSKYFLQNPLSLVDDDFSPADDYAMNVKLPKYSGLMPDGYKYIPVVWDSFGGLNEDGEHCLVALFKQLAQNNTWAMSSTISRSWQLLSCALQSSIASQIRDRAFPFSHLEFSDLM